MGERRWRWWWWWDLISGGSTTSRVSSYNPLLIRGNRLLTHNERDLHCSIDRSMASSSSAWEEVGMGRLPEGCISHVLSLMSPKETCRSSATSRAFRSAADSDEVWEGFLPRGYPNLLSRAIAPVAFQTKKELYFRLCRPTLIDGGRKSFVLEKSTGKICFMLSARELEFCWRVALQDPPPLNWVSLPNSRFSEVAKFNYFGWLSIDGKTSIELLSPKTPYVAYLIFKLTRVHYDGVEYPCQEAYIAVGTQSSTELISLFYHINQGPCGNVQNLPSWDRIAKHIPHVRMDGWMEIVLGEFFNADGVEGEVKVGIFHIDGGLFHRNLIVEGIELRPKNQYRSKSSF